LYGLRCYSILALFLRPDGDANLSFRRKLTISTGTTLKVFLYSPSPLTTQNMQPEKSSFVNIKNEIVKIIL